jgi:hydroxylamine reductase (hybrid-cluster protein)
MCALAWVCADLSFGCCCCLQCNDAYSALVVATELAKALNTDVNSLPLSLDISWFEQKVRTDMSRNGSCGGTAAAVTLLSNTALNE